MPWKGDKRPLDDESKTEFSEELELGRMISGISMQLYNPVDSDSFESELQAYIVLFLFVNMAKDSLIGVLRYLSF
jgi:hypothetical protein